MVWSVLVMMVLAVAQAQDSSVSKVEALEKQVEILTNLVNAQSNIMSRFTCNGGGSRLNPESECILRIANQTKRITQLQGDLQSLQALAKTKENVIQQLQTTVSDLSTNLKVQETKLATLGSKQAADVSSLQSNVQSALQKTNTLTSSVNQLGTKIQQVAGQWPSGSYCILASGNCPAGFTLRSGYMKAISLYAGNANYIKQMTFGDSKIQCHGRCGQYGHWTGELHINACCK